MRHDFGVRTDTVFVSHARIYRVHVHRMLAVAVFALLATPAAHASANPRLPATEVDGPITDIAVAASTGAVLVTFRDMYQGLLGDGEADQETWVLLSSDGRRVRSGSTDWQTSTADCGDRFGDPCRADAVAAAIAAGGEVFLVGARVADTAMDDVRGSVLLGTATGGIVARQHLPHIPFQVAVDQGGTSAVVLATHPGDASGTPLGAATPDQSTFYFYNISRQTLPAETARTLAGEPVDLALSADGSMALVATSALVLRVSARHEAAHSGGAGAPTAVALDATARWGVLGHASGDVALLMAGVPAARTVHRPGGAVSDVAITSDGAHYVAGDEEGRIHLFARDGNSRSDLLATLDLGDGPVQGLGWSDDGLLLSAYRDDTVYLLVRVEDRLRVLWNAPGATVQDLGLRGDATQVVVARDRNVTVYEALEAVQGQDVRVVVPEGSQENLTVELTNTGNRPADVRVALTAPETWNATWSPHNLSIQPGDARRVNVTVGIPATAAPDVYRLLLRHTLASGDTGQTAIEVEVPVRRDLVLRQAGPQSGAIDPGGVLTLPFAVRNDGNLRDEPSVDLVSVTPGWEAMLATVPGPLSPGDEAVGTLRIQAPPMAKQGDAGTALLRSGDQELRFTATVGALFALALDAPRGIAVPAGNTSIVDIRVTNRGNAPDSYILTAQTAGLPPGWGASFGGTSERIELAHVPPGETREVPFHASVPRDAPSNGVLNVRIEAASLADPDKKEQRQVVVSVTDAQTTTADPGSPGAPLLWVLAIFAGAGVVAHGRRQARR